MAAVHPRGGDVLGLSTLVRHVKDANLLRSDQVVWFNTAEYETVDVANLRPKHASVYMQYEGEPLDYTQRMYQVTKRIQSFLQRYTGDSSVTFTTKKRKSNMILYVKKTPPFADELSLKRWTDNLRRLCRVPKERERDIVVLELVDREPQPADDHFMYPATYRLYEQDIDCILHEAEDGFMAKEHDPQQQDWAVRIALMFRYIRGFFDNQSALPPRLLLNLTAWRSARAMLSHLYMGREMDNQQHIDAKRSAMHQADEAKGTAKPLEGYAVKAIHPHKALLLRNIVMYKDERHGEVLNKISQLFQDRVRYTACGLIYTRKDGYKTVDPEEDKVDLLGVNEPPQKCKLIEYPRETDPDNMFDILLCFTSSLMSMQECESTAHIRSKLMRVEVEVDEPRHALDYTFKRQPGVLVMRHDQVQLLLSQPQSQAAMLTIDGFIRHQVIPRILFDKRSQDSTFVTQVIKANRARFNVMPFQYEVEQSSGYVYFKDTYDHCPYGPCSIDAETGVLLFPKREVNKKAEVGQEDAKASEDDKSTKLDTAVGGDAEVASVN